MSTHPKNQSTGCSRTVGTGSASITNAFVTAQSGSIRPSTANSTWFPKARFVPFILGQRNAAVSIADGGLPDLFDNDTPRPAPTPGAGVVKRGRGRPPKDSTLAKKSKPSDEPAPKAVFKSTDVSNSSRSAGAAAGEESDEDEKESGATAGNPSDAIDYCRE